MRHAFFVVCILSAGFSHVVPAPVVTPSSQAQDAAAILSNARAVAVVGVTGRQLKNRLWANPSGERGKQKVEEVLAAWGHYQVVPDPGEADVVMVKSRGELQRCRPEAREGRLAASVRC